MADIQKGGEVALVGAGDVVVKELWKELVGDILDILARVQGVADVFDQFGILLSSCAEHVKDILF